MEYQKRKYPLFSACGLNCGLCPRYQMSGASKCPGCSGEGFLTKHPTCGVLSCIQRKALEYCYECDEYPCKKYDGADQTDSFITHRNQFKDMDKAYTLGIAAYKKELDEKVGILEALLENYDDGRRKGLFCTAVNLLEIDDVRYVLEQAKATLCDDLSQKEKAVAVAHLFQQIAEDRHISLKLRKK